MYYIDIYDTSKQKKFRKEFDSYYKFRKFYFRVLYSKKLMILSSSNLED